MHEGEGVLMKIRSQGWGWVGMESCKTTKYTYQENSATLSLSSGFQVKIFTYAK